MFVRGFILLLCGAVLGPLADYLHLATATTRYPLRSFPAGVSLFGMPLWVPLLFGVATLVIGLSHPFADRLLGGKKSRPGARSWLGATSGLAIFLGLYAASAFLPLETGGWRDVALGLGALSIWAIWEGTWQGLLLGTLTALGGTGVEILLVHFGVFDYTPQNANFFGVASWLPALYLAASVAIGNLGRRLQVALLPPPPPPSTTAATGRFSTTTGRGTSTGSFPSRT